MLYKQALALVIGIMAIFLLMVNAYFFGDIYIVNVVLGSLTVSILVSLAMIDIKILQRIRSYIISQLDSVILTFVYVSILTLITSGILYLTSNLIGLSMQQSLFILLLYYVLEVGTLFFSLPFREYPTLKELRSWPTLGILLSTPFALIYLSIRYRYIDFCKLEGIYVTWVLTRYNIVNPIWLRPQEQTENYNNGLKGMLSKLDKKPAPHSMTSSS